jgi:anti-anti-sigma factor
MSIESCVSVSLLFGATVEEQLAGVTVVWLHGEHDASTATQLSEAIRRAVDLDGMDVTLDLSDVVFMSAQTIAVITHANNSCEKQLLTLRLRNPSRSAQRIIELCGLEALVQEDEYRNDGRKFADRSRTAERASILESRPDEHARATSVAVA